MKNTEVVKSHSTVSLRKSREKGQWGTAGTTIDYSGHGQKVWGGPLSLSRSNNIHFGQNLGLNQQERGKSDPHYLKVIEIPVNIQNGIKEIKASCTQW